MGASASAVRYGRVFGLASASPAAIGFEVGPRSPRAAERCALAAVFSTR